jgi:hypothetical protein
MLVGLWLVCVIFELVEFFWTFSIVCSEILYTIYIHIVSQDTTIQILPIIQNEDTNTRKLAKCG